MIINHANTVCKLVLVLATVDTVVARLILRAVAPDERVDQQKKEKHFKHKQTSSRVVNKKNIPERQTNTSAAAASSKLLHCAKALLG